MADERDRLRRQLGLSPAQQPKPTPVVDERTQRQAMAAAAATPVVSEPKRYYNYYTGEWVDSPDLIKPRILEGTPIIEEDDESVIEEDDESVIEEDDEGTEDTGKTLVDTYIDETTGDVIAVYSDGTTSILSKGTKKSDAAAKAAADALAAKQAAEAAAEEKRRQGASAYALLFSEFERYGLGALVEPLKGFITEGLSPAEFTLRLRETDAYKKRFAANQARIQKGLRALSEAEYIGLEDQYQDVMRRYGLPETYYTRGDMGIQQGFEKFIGGDVSPVELEDRIQTAQRRVINAAPEVTASLRSFYPEIGQGDLLAYFLDPDKAIENIKRKVTAAEIGGAATMAGLTTGMARAEELSRFGVTGEQARLGFQTIADILPRGSQLAEIYKQSPYTQTTAEQEVFGITGATEASKRRRQLTQLETAAFSGQAGATGGALGRERAGAF